MSEQPTPIRRADQALLSAAAFAAESQAEFTAYMNANPLNAEFFLKLISLCDGKLAEAIVLFHAIQSAEKFGLATWQQMARENYVREYGTTHCSLRSYERATAQLIEDDYFSEMPRLPTTARKYFLNWPVLSKALSNDVDMKLPGLRSGNGSYGH